MTNEEIENMIEEMQKMFGDDLPNPIQEPIRFAYYIKLYKFYTERKVTNDTESSNN